ncbi:ferric reductase-like transmembrane domain-containing protein [Nocardia sp. NPDC052254]|uniref:ferric reductase-like transmembrane domain-containing protein n=1 Tax=Nocardia sp. NPDC052254 TaxID=3155681 RepID=UPI00341A1035
MAEHRPRAQTPAGIVSNPWLWYASRACGVVTMVLLTVVVLLGLFTASGSRPHDSSPTVAMGLHRTLGLGIAVFLAAHVTTAVIDSYVPIGAISAVAPFTADYHRRWVGLGTIAFDLLVAVVLTSLLRHRLPARVWRVVHGATYVLAPIAVIHGLMMATTKQPILSAVTLGCAIAMASGAIWRWLSRPADARRRADLSSGEWT